MKNVEKKKSVGDQFPVRYVRNVLQDLNGEDYGVHKVWVPLGVVKELTPVET